MKAALLFFLIVSGIILFLANISLGIFDNVFFLEKLRVSDIQEQVVEVLNDVLQEQTTIDVFLQEVAQEISAPPPIRVSDGVSSSILTKIGVLAWTNLQREQNGLPPLLEDSLLDSIAKAKLQDMFDKQYFAHVSPIGIGVGDLAMQYGYEFIAIGENLALGNYENDQDLVQAWMDSPGHRENILNQRYEAIGIAVGKGLFEGSNTWLAVQSFGKPLSSCDLPDEVVEQEIESTKTQIDDLESVLDMKRSELQGARPRRGAAYNRQVHEYNQLVSRYNDLIAQVENLIVRYNIQINQFNECAKA